jgi:transcription elongation GreA/GreB family factor
MNALATSDRPFPNEHGRRLREEHIRVLEASVDELHIALDDSELGTDSTDGYQRAVRELASLRSHLDSAGAIEDIPDDPRIGDTVTILLDDGTEETYIIVHAVEAPVEDQRISTESPLGCTLLGHHVGDTVEVAVPAGSYGCRILSAGRPRLGATAPSPTLHPKPDWTASPPERRHAAPGDRGTQHRFTRQSRR